MKVGLFNHLYLRGILSSYGGSRSQRCRYAQARSNIPCIVTLDERFRIMDLFGDYRR